jgi:hypothetical protein
MAAIILHPLLLLPPPLLLLSLQQFLPLTAQAMKIRAFLFWVVLLMLLLLPRLLPLLIIHTISLSDQEWQAQEEVKKE